MKSLHPEVINSLACPECGSDFKPPTSTSLQCSNCGYRVRINSGKPIFTAIPPGMTAAPKLIRGRDKGSSWRRANWRFLENAVAQLPAEAIVLDVGAGHGDFSEVLDHRSCIALDVFPYDEVDVVCDLQRAIPFKRRYFDAIVLMNVLEHIPQAEELIAILSTLLKPTGIIIVTVPFLLKLHQLPYDYSRFSHVQLVRMGKAAGLEIANLEGYYDPLLLFAESQNNLLNHVLPNYSYLPRKIARLVSMGLSIGMGMLKVLIGKGSTGSPDEQKNPYPIGYHVIYEMRKGRKDQTGNEK
jgi:SAM-dependent methyltransferase/DNA-directed RNA polymerase subunit RPC12/RpoP